MSSINVFSLVKLLLRLLFNFPLPGAALMFGIFLPYSR